jgi:hypothetical protein
MASRWQTHPSAHEIESFCWKTWEASESEALAEVATCVAVLENHLKYLENESGRGYLGQTWKTIVKAGGKSQKWTEHQNVVRHMAKFNSGNDFDRLVRIWHRGRSWGNTEKSREDADKYARDFSLVYNRYYDLKPRPAYKECEL